MGDLPKIPRAGVIIRTYNVPGKAEADIAKDIDRAVANARRASGVAIDGVPVFTRVVLVVPKDHDYGGTAERLRAGFAQARIVSPEVVEVGGADRAPVAIDQGGLGVQDPRLVFKYAHAGRQHPRIGRAAGPLGDSDIALARHQQPDINAALGGGA